MATWGGLTKGLLYVRKLRTASIKAEVSLTYSYGSEAKWEHSRLKFMDFLIGNIVKTLYLMKFNSNLQSE